VVVVYETVVWVVVVMVEIVSTMELDGDYVRVDFRRLVVYADGSSVSGGRTA
jgi:hypothetical protein